MFRFFVFFFTREFSIKASIYPGEPLRALRFLCVRSSAHRYATTQTETPGMTRPGRRKSHFGQQRLKGSLSPTRVVVNDVTFLSRRRPLKATRAKVKPPCGSFQDAARTWKWKRSETGTVWRCGRKPHRLTYLMLIVSGGRVRNVERKKNKQTNKVTCCEGNGKNANWSDGVEGGRAWKTKSELCPRLAAGKLQTRRLYRVLVKFFSWKQRENIKSGIFFISTFK